MTELEALRTLHLEDGCSDAQRRQAYRDLVKVWHPDRFEGDSRLSARAARTLQSINEAYAVLEGRASRSSRPIDVSPAVAPQPPSDSRSPFAASSPRATVTPSRGRSFRIVAAAVGVGILVGGGATAIVLTRSGRAMSLIMAATGSPDRTVETATGLANADATVPDRSAQRSPRPQSGVELLAPPRTGGGALVIYNGSRRDAVVALAAQGGHERAVYVRAGEEVTLANVATGSYRVQMMVGRDWSSDRFGRDAAYQELDQPVQFVERGDGNTVEYTKLTVALQVDEASPRGIRQTRPFRITRR
jgi:hypothetical protein